MKKIFCVEDDSDIRELIEYTLNSMGFEVKGFEAAAGFFAALKNNIPSLVLLDIMLPDKDGTEILRELKETSLYKNIPVIMLTAKSGQIDKIKGLDGGADDYITKPFDIMELVSRINAVLRRAGGADKECSGTLVYKELELNSASRRVKAEGKEIALTYKEFELLHYLMVNMGIVLTREKIMNEIWGTEFEGETRTVDVHIRTLRQKLGGCGDYIDTVRSVGYKIG